MDVDILGGPLRAPSDCASRSGCWRPIVDRALADRMAFGAEGVGEVARACSRPARRTVLRDIPVASIRPPPTGVASAPAPGTWNESCQPHHPMARRHQIVKLFWRPLRCLSRPRIPPDRSMLERRANGDRRRSSSFLSPDREVRNANMRERLAKANHHVLDRSFDEDRIRTGREPENTALLRRFAISIIKARGPAETMRRLGRDVRRVLDFQKMTRQRLSMPVRGMPVPGTGLISLKSRPGRAVVTKTRHARSTEKGRTRASPAQCQQYSTFDERKMTKTGDRTVPHRSEMRRIRLQDGTTRSCLHRTYCWRRSTCRTIFLGRTANGLLVRLPVAFASAEV